MNSHGIDYGHGMANIDHKTGIRYGVISVNAVGQAWFDDGEGIYGDACCPYCGDPAEDIGEMTEEEEENIENYEYDQTAYEYCCHNCKRVFSSGDAMSHEPCCYVYLDQGYICEQHSDSTNIFIIKSRYFTFAQFCSPCAPGAVHLENPLLTKVTGKTFHKNFTPSDMDNRGYCFSHDWFEEGKAPYTVYSVETGKVVNPKD